MTDATASLPPKPLLVHPPAITTPGLEDDTVATGDTGQFWSTEEGPTFAEFLDIINPLHHIPGISTIYRAISGDEIGAGPRFIGGMLFGGPIGAIAAGVTALFEEASGGDVGQHLAEIIDDFTGGGDDAPAVAATAAAGPDSDPAKGQLAALAATAPGTPAQGNTGRTTGATANTAVDMAAQNLNRISLNPAAALGAPQAAALGAVQNVGQNAARNTAQNIGRNAADAAVQQAALRDQPARLPKGAKIFPAHPTRTAAPHPMLMPFGGNRPDGVVRAAAPAAVPTAQPVAHQVPQQAGQQVSAAVSRSRRQQADLMLAQWAAQQMAQQNGAPGSTGKKPRSGNDEDPRAAQAAPTAQAAAAAQKAAAHPMLPPRNASPEWYAQAMDKALNQYRSGANTLPAGVPSLSVTR